MRLWINSTNGFQASAKSHRQRKTENVEIAPSQAVESTKTVFLPTRPGWAFDFTAKAILKHLGPKYDLDIQYGANNPKREYGSSVVFWHRQRAKVDKKRSAVCLVDGLSWNDARLVQLGQEYACICARNHKFAERARKLVGIPVFEIQPGIDPSVFNPGERKANYDGKLTVGWSGLQSRNTFSGNKDAKGLHLLEEVKKKLPNVEFKYATGKVKHSEMPAFYRSIDVLLIASVEEGVPLPLLEAMACGTRVISTDVGIVPEVLLDGGKIDVVSRRVEDFVSAISRVDRDRSLLAEAVALNPVIIKKGWTWEQRGPVWEKVFDCLGSKLIKKTIITNGCIGYMATYPGRGDVLEKAVASLVGQLDRLYIYLNEYESVPEMLTKFGNVYPILGKDALGNIGPRGKFYRPERIGKYHLTVDDDFEYPVDYVSSSIDAVNRYGGEALISFHGIKLPAHPAGFKQEDAPRLMGTDTISKDTPTNWLGTGMLAYSTDHIGIPLEELGEDCLVDPYVAMFAQKRKIPMVVAAHKKGWIRDLQYKSASKTRLHHKLNRGEGAYVDLIKGFRRWYVFEPSKSGGIIHSLPDSSEVYPGYSVIMTGYKRDYFERQLESIRSQTIKPNEIYLWQNGDYVSADWLRNEGVRLVKSPSMNFKFHGRFTLPLLLNSEYTLILDDDCCPARNWAANAKRLCEERDCIVGARGGIIGEGSYYDGVFDPSKDTEVDLVGHAWFFKTEWIRHMWAFRPPRWDNGEDIHFSAACKILEGIETWIPGVESKDDSGNLETGFGSDNHASYKRASHKQTRMNLIDYWRSLGWETVNAL